MAASLTLSQPEEGGGQIVPNLYILMSLLLITTDKPKKGLFWGPPYKTWMCSRRCLNQMGQKKVKRWHSINDAFWRKFSAFLLWHSQKREILHMITLIQCQFSSLLFWNGPIKMSKNIVKWQRWKPFNKSGLLFTYLLTCQENYLGPT